MTEDRLSDTSVRTSARTSALTGLFRHNTWANLKLLEFCAGLSDEQLRATAVGAYGSIRATLAHLVGAEVDYVSRVTGAAPDAWLAEERFPGFDALKDSARRAGDELLRLAIEAPAGAVVREEFSKEVTVVEYPVSSLLVQAINHATEHRTQVSAIITQLGMEPPDMAGWAYMEEHGEFRETRAGTESSGAH